MNTLACVNSLSTGLALGSVAINGEILTLKNVHQPVDQPAEREARLWRGYTDE
jgi:hypothetical protein